MKTGPAASSVPSVDANELNTFFATLSSRTVSSLPAVQNSGPLNNVPVNNHNFYINPTDCNETILTTLGLATKLSSGYDELSVKLLKFIFSLIADPLCHIINRSFQTGIIPDQLKVARVVPLFKGDDKSLMHNYRPISILPSISKIIERLMYNRLLSFLDTYKLLSNYQYGFRKNKSTEDAVINLCDYVTHCLDNGQVVLGMFVDVSKAFDSIDHTILLRKL